MTNNNAKIKIIVTDKKLNENDKDILKDSVVYRVPNLVVGIGLHWDLSLIHI